MITPTKGSGRVSPVFQALPHTSATHKPARSQSADAQFDQVQISNSSEGQSFQKLVSKLVGEVRTAHTTGDIQSVKQEIQNGTYRIDPSEIAARMLLESGG